MPYPVALAAAYVSELVADVATQRIPAATVTGVKLTRRTMHFDASRSLAELGLRPRPGRSRGRLSLTSWRSLHLKSLPIESTRPALAQVLTPPAVE